MRRANWWRWRVDSIINNLSNTPWKCWLKSISWYVLTVNLTIKPFVVRCYSGKWWENHWWCHSWNDKSHWKGFTPMISVKFTVNSGNRILDALRGSTVENGPNWQFRRFKGVPLPPWSTKLPHNTLGTESCQKMSPNSMPDTKTAHRIWWKTGSSSNFYWCHIIVSSQDF